MKAKILTLALFGLMAFSFMACNDEAIEPVKDVTIEQSIADCECEGGITDREDPTVD